MDVTQLKFLNKKTVISYLGDSSDPSQDDLDDHSIKRYKTPHPDLFAAADAFVVHFLKHVGIDPGNGNYKVKEIKVAYRDEKESITATIRKILKGDQECEITIPTIEVKDDMVDLFEELCFECSSYVSSEKLAQTSMEFPEDGEQQSEEEIKQGEPVGEAA